MASQDHEAELEGSDPRRGGHPSPADLERFMRGEMGNAERQVIVRHLLTRCEKCCAITSRLWNHGSRQTLSLIEMLANPEMRLPGRRRPGRPKKWNPRWNAAVSSLESVAQEILREYAQELENLRDRLEVLAAGLSRMPPADPDRVSIAEELHAAITCVLQDALRQAIDDLHAAAKYTAEPKEGDPVP
jgi:hypothetical protein